MAGCHNWHDVAQRLTPELLSTPVSALPLPKNLQRVAREQNLKSLAELLHHPGLPARKRTFTNALAVLGQPLLRPLEPPGPYDLSTTSSFLEAFRERLAILRSDERDIIEARSGMQGAVPHWKSLAVRHQRSKQALLNWESSAFSKICKDGFATAVEARIHKTWAGSVLALDERQARWLCSEGQHEAFLTYVLDHLQLSSARPHRVEALGRSYLMPWTQGEFDREWKLARLRLSRLEYPASRETVKNALGEHGRGAALDEPLMRCAQETLL